MRKGEVFRCNQEPKSVDSELTKREFPVELTELGESPLKRAWALLEVKGTLFLALKNQTAYCELPMERSGLQELKHKGINSGNKLRESGSRSFPDQTSK